MPNEQYKLNAANVRLTPTAEGKAAGKQAVVTLEGLRVKRLASRDASPSEKLLKNREGVLTLRVGGQATAISWATDADGNLSNRSKFTGQVLFLGAHKGLLPVEVTLIESDEEDRKRLAQAMEALKQLAKAAGMTPAMGAPVAAAAGLAGAALEVVRLSVDDDTELTYHGSIGGGEEAPTLRLTTYRLIRGPEGDPDLEILLRVHDLVADDQLQATVVLNSVVIELPKPKGGALPGIPTSRRHQARVNGTLVIESSFGSGSNTGGLSLKEVLHNGRDGEQRIDRFVGIQGRLLYRGPCAAGVPFSVNATYVHKDDEKQLEAFLNLAVAGADLVGALSKDEADQARAKEVSKGIQSVKSIAMELLPDKVSIGNISGLIAGADQIGDTLRPGPNVDDKAPRSVLILRNVPGEWQRVELKMGSERGGSATFVLGVKISGD